MLRARKDGITVSRAVKEGLGFRVEVWGAFTAYGFTSGLKPHTFHPNTKPQTLTNQDVVPLWRRLSPALACRSWLHGPGHGWFSTTFLNQKRLDVGPGFRVRGLG